VTAMTACPCAQEIFRGIAFEKLVKLGVSDDIATAFLDEMPMPTHNQRGIGTISIRCGEEADVCLDTIVDIIENSMSSPVYELLKREDEKYVVERAHRNPKFVEDCVRAMARDLVCRLPDLPDDASIAISQVNEESIHRHNAFAERTALFGELKKEIRRNSR
jgi:GTP cyclohydrolase-4